MEWLSDEQRFSAIEENLKIINEEIAEAAIKSGRTPNDVNLMAVTKTVESRFINHAINNGVKLIGENKVQELLLKEPELHLESCRAHLIGHLQSNKVKYLIGNVFLIHSISSIKLIKTVEKESAKRDATTDILLQFNLAEEDTKSGFSADEMGEALALCAECPHVRLSGLMCIGSMTKNPSDILKIFTQLKQMYDTIKATYLNGVNSVRFLSMGMTDDYPIAVSAGSNMVRIGRKIFYDEENIK